MECSAEPTIKKEGATVIVGLILWVAVLVHEGCRFRSEVCIGAVLDCADSSSMRMWRFVSKLHWQEWQRLLDLAKPLGEISKAHGPKRGTGPGRSFECYRHCLHHFHHFHHFRSSSWIVIFSLSSSFSSFSLSDLDLHWRMFKEKNSLA